MFDKTKIFNLLAAIAGVIMLGGDAMSLNIPEGIPEWGVPILLFVAVAINHYSREQVKTEASEARYNAKDALFVDGSTTRVGISSGASFDEGTDAAVALGHYQPKIFILKKEMPGIKAGTLFQQSRKGSNVYFHCIPISGSKPEGDQVGIVEFDAQHVEDNPEWFERFHDEDADAARGYKA